MIASFFNHRRCLKRYSPVLVSLVDVVCFNFSVDVIDDVALADFATDDELRQLMIMFPTLVLLLQLMFPYLKLSSLLLLALLLVLPLLFWLFLLVTLEQFLAVDSSFDTAVST